MKVLDPGHAYRLNQFDTINSLFEIIDPVELVFVKREGEGYPGNVGHYPGTNLQEVCRVCINRLKYLDNQISNPVNIPAINHFRSIIRLLEIRAAERHGRPWVEPMVPIELVPTCPTCGHIGCIGNH